MANFEKIIKGTDAVLNCIPIVSTISNAAQAIYKLAHKVDTLNPVAPGLKTSIKIHILSKTNLEFFIHSIPIIGNFIALIELTASILEGFDDDLMDAVFLNNTEVMHLCLGNGALNDPVRAEIIFAKSAFNSNNETFRQVLNSRADWSNKNLLHSLRDCRNPENANDMLDYWKKHKKVLGADDISSAIGIVRNFTEAGSTALAGRVIGILPEQVPFDRISHILLTCSCAQYNSRGEVKVAGALTEEHRNALIAKSARPSLKELKDHYNSVGDQIISNNIADNYHETHFDTLNKLLDLAQLPSDVVGEFIASTVNYDEFAFTESLIAKYKEQITPQSKMNILERLLPSATKRPASHAKRAELFASWIDQWKNDVSARAHELYTNISTYGEIYIKRAEKLVHAFWTDYPSVENLQTVNAKFKQILLDTFPGCDQPPQEAAI